jgi:hypothetical protein
MALGKCKKRREGDNLRATTSKKCGHNAKSIGTRKRLVATIASNGCTKKHMPLIITRETAMTKAVMTIKRKWSQAIARVRTMAL